jgi:hypothetical protein
MRKRFKINKKFFKINKVANKFKKVVTNFFKNPKNKDVLNKKESNLNKEESGIKNLNLKFLKNSNNDFKGFNNDEFKNQKTGVKNGSKYNKKSKSPTIFNKEDNQETFTKLNNKKPNNSGFSTFLRNNIFSNKDKSDGDGDKILDYKKKSLKTNKENKTIVGGVVFIFIVTTLILSAYFFFIYSPFSEELRTAKIEKLNELNSLYKGPLAVNDKAISLRSEVNNAKSPEEVKLIDILQPATISWREYHNHQINVNKDDYGRVMIKYLTDDAKSILLSVDDGHLFVNTNDATILSKLNFIKPDTIIVPVTLSRLQAGGGLISVGSVVDIYFLSSEDYKSKDGNVESTIKTNGTSNGEEDSIESGKMVSTTKNKTSDNSNIQYSGYNSQLSYSDKNPTISGAIVVAIMLSKSNGVIDGNYLKSQKSVDGNLSNIVENEESFSTDVEEILKSIAAGGFNEDILNKFLNDFGLKLSDYERVANIAELDTQYLILLEIPRNDVHLLINNMDNMRITIPTNRAPNWVVNELKSKYFS